MAEFAYTSNVRVERIKGPLRRAFLPGEPQPDLYSTEVTGRDDSLPSFSYF